MQAQRAISVSAGHELENNAHDDSSRSVIQSYSTKFNPSLHQASSEPTKIASTSNRTDIQNEELIPSRAGTFFTGWQKTVILNCTCSILALACNIGLFVWAQTKPRTTSNTFLLWDGDCGRSKTISTWSHFGINVLSSILLASSNYAMQILVAPTRKDLDAAHGDGRSLTVGIQGFTNWSYLGRWRKLLYVCLLLTSIPLHLIYNSVIFSTISSFDFSMQLVTQDFLKVQPNGTFIYSLWQNASQSPWVTLDNQECYSTFAVDFVHDYKNVILVTQFNSSEYNTSWFAETWHDTVLGGGFNYEWFCGSYSCEPDISQANDWKINSSVIALRGYEEPPVQLPDEFQIQHCLAQPSLPSCTVEFMPELLTVVIVGNVLKTVALIVLVFLKFDPLVTIGDAIASFMDVNDSTTKEWGTVSAAELQASGPKHQSTSPKFQPRISVRQWKFEAQRYFCGAARGYWIVTLILCFTSWVICCTIERLAVSSSHTSMKQQWSDGIGSIILDQIATSLNVSIVGLVLVTNIPQLALSLVYLFYNSLFTCMLVSAEWTNFAHQKKGLRVTRPAGDQRSTYFLSLPYRFSLPLLLVSMLLHWMISQSLFLAQINIYDCFGKPLENGGIHTIGWSTLAFMMFLIVGGLLIVGLAAFGFKRYKPGIPLVLSDSRAISAACHAENSSDRNQSLRKLQYGIIAATKDDKCCIGFSSRPVKPLLDEEIFT